MSLEKRYTFPTKIEKEGLWEKVPLAFSFFRRKGKRLPSTHRCPGECDTVNNLPL